MVKLTEVEDEHFQDKQPGKDHEVLLASDDDDYTDTDSEISEASDDSPAEESLFDRIYALRDMIPPSSRRRIASTTSTVTSLTKSSLLFSGKALWIVSTSVLLLGVPWALAYSEEQQMIEMEKEQGMMQRGASEMLAQPGAPAGSTPQGSQGGRPAL